MTCIKSRFIILLALFGVAVSTTHAYVQVPAKKIEFSTGILKGKDTKDMGVGVGVGYGLTDYLQLHMNYSYYNDHYKQTYLYTFESNNNTYHIPINIDEDITVNTMSLGLTGKINLPFSALRISGSRFIARASAGAVSDSLEGFDIGTQFMIGKNSKVKPYISKTWNFYSDSDYENDSSTSFGAYFEAAKNVNLVLDHTIADDEGLTTIGVMFYH